MFAVGCNKFTEFDICGQTKTFIGWKVHKMISDIDDFFDQWDWKKCVGHKGNYVRINFIWSHSMKIS